MKQAAKNFGSPNPRFGRGSAFSGWGPSTFWVTWVVALLFFSLPATADVLKIVVDDTIHPITEEFITRALNQAQARHAEAVLIELRTPGGLESSTRQIVEKILASPVPVIVYVSPAGSRAASAGFFILESADVAAMAPGTNTGAAHPVMLGGGKMDDVMKEKVTNDSAAFMRSIVSKRGRNVQVAESAVRESKSFTDQEALSQHLVDAVAPTEQDLFKQLDGKSITRFNGEKLTLHLAGKNVSELDMTLKQRILSFLMDPNVSFIVLAIGLLALYVEFNHPGAIVPGVVGFFFVVLAVFALNVLPVRYTALALILMAFVFFALEAKFASHGVLTVAGIAALTIGALLLVDTPIPQMRVHLWTALAVSVPLGLITTFLMGIALKARRAKITTGVEGLIGEIGIARTPLTPEGKVFVHGELWNATASGTVEAGEQVRVRAIDGLRLEVERAVTPTRSEAATRN
ncbi:MAG TPA: nodulation protein NfeD [Terriglobales bacterium]|nr:nodulation protein NfeD [Terriglobales bacterium]